MRRVHSSPVAHYYDRNTRRFLRFAPRGAGATIHRALWGPGVKTRTAAVNYIHDLLLQLLQQPPVTPTPVSPRRPVVWDLGCGIGASLRYLAERQAGDYVGVTISATQVLLAERMGGGPAGAKPQPLVPHHEPGHAVSEQSSGDPQFLQADFCDPIAFDQLRAVSPAAPSLVYLIESFGHATDPHLLLRQIADSLAPQGLLVICDDFPATAESRDRREVRQFVEGWRISTFWTPEEIAAELRSRGLQLVESRDLTAYVELNRLRDRLIQRVIGLPDMLGRPGARLAATPFWGNMRGGSALQRGLAHGNIHYRMLAFTKR